MNQPVTPLPVGAVEAMPEGGIAAVDAMEIADAGIFGDILCSRMKKRGRVPRPGLYPMNEDTKARYAADKAAT